MKYERFEQLPVWQAVIELARNAYRLSKQLALRREPSPRGHSRQAPIPANRGTPRGGRAPGNRCERSGIQTGQRGSGKLSTVNCGLLPGSKGSVFGNEAKNPLKRKEEFWNEAKRSQETPFENLHHIENTEDACYEGEPDTVYSIENMGSIHFGGKGLKVRGQVLAFKRLLQDTSLGLRACGFYFPNSLFGTSAT